jgi:hypothetical protein
MPVDFAPAPWDTAFNVQRYIFFIREMDTLEASDRCGYSSTGMLAFQFNWGHLRQC